MGKDQTKPNQTKPDQIRPNQTKPDLDTDAAIPPAMKGSQGRPALPDTITKATKCPRWSGRKVGTKKHEVSVEFGFVR